MACLNGHLQALPLLLSAGADVDACDNRFKKTALSYAVMLGRVDLMRELIQHNANMCSLDRHGRTPFDRVWKWNSRTEEVALLIHMYSNRLSREDEDRVAFHRLLVTAQYSFADFDDEHDHALHPPLHPLRVKIPLGTLPWNHFRTLLWSLDAAVLRRRDDRGALPIHVACRSSIAPVEVLATFVERDAARGRSRGSSATAPCARSTFR